MIRILIELLVLVMIIAIATDESLRTQATALGGDMYEFIKQSVALVFNQGKDLLKNSK